MTINKTDKPVLVTNQVSIRNTQNTAIISLLGIFHSGDASPFHCPVVFGKAFKYVTSLSGLGNLTRHISESPHEAPHRRGNMTPTVET